MASITMIELMKVKYTVNYNNKKEIFSEIRDILFEQINDVKLSSLKNPKIIEEVKTLKIIELDDLKSFYTYANYDHFLIFKVKDDYYFCITDLIYSLNVNSMVKISDYHQYLRKDKLDKINKENINI